MWDIYRNAQAVVVWLGELNESTILACEFLDRIGKLKHHQMKLPNLASPGTGSASSESSLDDYHKLKSWQAVLDLLSRTWFTRSWVVQELVLAQDVVVLCGNRIIEWNYIERVSHHLATQASYNTLRTLLNNIEESYYKMPAKLAAIKRDLVDQKPDTLLKSLIRCRDFNCLQPADKIYSLLGIYQAITGKLHPADSLYPDYTVVASSVYVHAAVEILKRSTSLALLTVAEGEDFRNIEDLPSWVPDWSYNCGIRGSSLGLGITGYERFNAAKKVGRSIQFLSDDRVLSVKAARLDQVSMIGETKLQVYKGERFDRWLDIMESLNQVYEPTGESRSEVFWRTLITNTDIQGKWNPSSKYGIGFSGWLGDRTVEFPSYLQKRTRRLFSMHEIIPKLTRKDDSATITAEYDVQYAHSLYQRLFSTSKGFIGLTSQSIKEGRKYSVWIVGGSRVPLVFSENQKGVSSYKLVGGAYVHGFMQGESSKLNLDYENICLA